MIDRRPGAVVRCRRRKRRDAGGAPCPRQRPARGGARRWPQHCRQRGLRGRAPDRPVADALRPHRPEEAHRAGRARRHARRVRQGGAGLRSCHAARHQLDHRGRRAHAWWRLRVAQPQIRVHGRQSDLRRCGDRRRRARSGKRGGEPRPFLGHPRRWRQFRRRDVVRVQTASGRSRPSIGADRPPVRARPRAPCRLSRGRGGRARRAHRLGGAAQGAASAVPAGRGARQGDPGLRRLLCRRAGECGEARWRRFARSASRSPT